jgi:hypothetical protein
MASGPKTRESSPEVTLVCSVNCTKSRRARAIGTRTMALPLVNFLGLAFQKVPECEWH